MTNRQLQAFERAEVALGALLLELTGTVGMSQREITSKIGSSLLSINDLKTIMYGY